MQQLHVDESDWKYAKVKTKNGKTKQMRMDVHLAEEDISHDIGA